MGSDTYHISTDQKNIGLLSLNLVGDIALKAIVRTYGVEVQDRPLPVIPRGWVLVRVYSAAWGGVEEAIASNLLWVRPGRILGFQGYGVVVELGIGAPKWLSGKRVVFGRLPIQYSFQEYQSRLWSIVEEAGPPPGTAFDGWLAEYVALPSSAVTEIDSSLPVELLAITTSASIAWSVGKYLATSVDAEKVAVAGSGPTALLAAYAAREFGREVPVYADQVHEPMKGLAKELGVSIERISQMRTRIEPGRGYGAIFVATLDPIAAEAAAETLWREGELLLHPIYAYAEPPRILKGCVKLIKNFPGSTGLVLLRKIRDAQEVLMGVMDELVVPPIPRPKPFIAYRLARG